MKRVLFLLKISALICICFLGFMVVAHVFGDADESPLNQKELIGLLLFPTSIFMGLIISLWQSTIGGLIGSLAMTAFFALYPEVIFNPYFLIPALTSISMLLTGLYLKKNKGIE